LDWLLRTLLTAGFALATVFGGVVVDVRPNGSLLAADPSGEAPDRDAAATRSVAFSQAVADARKALARRDLTSARKYVATASQTARTVGDRDQVDRLKIILGHLDQFWKGVRAAMAKLEVTDVILVNGKRAIVAESGPDGLTVKTAGQTYHYQVETLPTPLVMTLVDQYFGKDVDSRAIIGTFLAVDPKGDRATARKYWEAAARANIGTESLMPELELFPPSQAPEKAKSTPGANKAKRPS
jgi:hypothetical protein